MRNPVTFCADSVTQLRAPTIVLFAISVLSA
jgi:hypothetical protein